METAFRVGDLAIAIDGPIATIAIDRPAKLNALTAAIWSDLPAALDRLTAADDIRAIIVTGAGGKAFSAGGDIPGFLSLQTAGEIRAYQEAAMAAFRHVEDCPLPVIAAVNGIAFGGGCELAMACDVVIAAEHAQFALPEAALGLVPGFGILRGPEIFGRHMTKYLIATGDRLTAEQAQVAGLVQHIFPADRLMTEARAIAARIASRSPRAVSTAKRMANRTIDGAAAAYSVEEISALQASPDRAIGIAAFKHRTPPVFPPRPRARG